MSNYEPIGKIILLHNVDIDSSYSHEFYFESASAQYNFFYSKKFKELDNGTYQRKNKNTLTVNYNADEIRECKYLMWQNPTYSNKWYYAFVLGVDYENPKTTIIRYQLDVYQTYLFEMEWKPSFIERKHCQQYDSDGLPIVNTLPEEIDYGTNYLRTHLEVIKQLGNTSFMVIGTTLSPSSQGGFIGLLPTNLKYYIIPFDSEYVGSGISTGYYLNDDTNLLSNIGTVLRTFRTNQTLVNSLVSCYITPYLTISNISQEDATSYNKRIRSTDLQMATVEGLNMIEIKNFENPYSTFEYLTTITNIYNGFNSFTESKLYMYPYSFIELSTRRGDSFIIKPEFITTGTDRKRLKIGILSNNPSYQNKIIAMVKWYSTFEGAYDISNALVDNVTDSLPIVDDYTASYLQSNKNANEVAIFNQQESMYNDIKIAEQNYTVAVGNSQAKRTTSAIGDTLTSMVGIGTLMALNAIPGIGTAASVGLAVGGVGSAATGLGGLLSESAGQQADVASAQQTLDNAIATAKTNYQINENAVLAKIQDAEQIPPSSKALGGDYIFDNVYECDRLYLTWKNITTEYADKISKYFKQFGYKVNTLEQPNFHTRANWNYIKMIQPNVMGNIPMDDLHTIRNIFINGITLWHGDYVGDYSRNNIEI